MGREAPLPIRALPEPINPIHLLGPGMALTALGVGVGETFLWPRMVIAFGPNVRWLFLVGVTVQLFVMMEMARWAMATGESIFFAAARLHRSVMWFFFACALLIYIWPGHMATGAQSIEDLTGLPWLPVSIIGLVLIGLILTFSKYVYNVVESVLTVFVSILVIGSAIIASLVGNFGDLGATIRGTFAFGYTDPNMFTDAWFPLIAGAIAFAGPSGMQQMWYTLWLRDKGAGMGRYIPRIKGLRALGDGEETMPARGYTFDTEDPDEMRKWKGWRSWNIFDAVVLFWGITMVTTVVFTVLALAATRENPGLRNVLTDPEGERAVAIEGMAQAFGSVGGSWAEVAFFIFIGIVGWKLSFGLFDALSRGQADMSHYFVPALRRFSMSKLYLGFVWLIVLAGIPVLILNEGEEPTFILDVLAFLSSFVMGAYCLLLLFTNNKLLPGKLRPGIIGNLFLGLGALMYLGGILVSFLFFGAFPD
jgi:hypothetical protein